MGFSRRNRPVAVENGTILCFHSDVLTAQGYQVDGAADGEEGWNMLQVHPYDLLITDYSIPRLSCTDLFKKIRGDWAGASGNSRNGVFFVNPEGLPFNARLSKPFFADELIQTVKRGLEQFLDD